MSVISGRLMVSAELIRSVHVSKYEPTSMKDKARTKYSVVSYDSFLEVMIQYKQLLSTAQRGEGGEEEKQDSDVTSDFRTNLSYFEKKDLQPIIVYKTGYSFFYLYQL